MAKLIEWTEEFEICPEIDKQHKKIIDLINKLYNALTEAKARDVIKEIILELKDYTSYHFSTEEELFKKYNYKDADAHIEEHNFLRKKVVEFIERLENNDEFLIYDVMAILRDWLRHHILNTDKKYKNEIC